MASDAYKALNRAWNSTCKILFGQEIGDLEDFAVWLSEYDEKIRTEKSFLSGKPVSFSQNDYADNAKFVAFDEVELNKFQPLSINEIKDIDSIIEAVVERLCYTGNIILGNCSAVENSSNVTDSHVILNSTVVSDSKYIGYTRHVRNSQYCFGLLGAEKDNYVIKSMGSELSRCFECHMVELLSDCYYCAKTQNCRECFFCFGTHGGAYMMGNTKLPKDKYLATKAKLLGEIADTLKSQKGIFSLLTVIEKASGHGVDKRLKYEKEEETPFDISPIEEAFGKTSALLLGRELHGIEQYRDFLQKHVPKNVIAHSPLSGLPSVGSGYRAHILKKFPIERRMPTEKEMIWIGRNEKLANIIDIKMDENDLAEKFHPIAYTNLDKAAGNNSNFKNCPVIIDCQDCLEGSAFIHSKKCAYCFWASSAEAVFGSCAAFNSLFCMKNFFCKNMARSFECDGCNSCTNAYFLHNCENVHDSMFCFNAKNLRRAVGNTALSSEQYDKIRSAIISQIAEELEQKKDLRWDIFNVGESR